VHSKVHHRCIIGSSPDCCYLIYFGMYLSTVLLNTRPHSQFWRCFSMLFLCEISANSRTVSLQNLSFCRYKLFCCIFYFSIFVIQFFALCLACCCSVSQTHEMFIRVNNVSYLMVGKMQICFCIMFAAEKYQFAWLWGFSLNLWQKCTNRNLFISYASRSESTLCFCVQHCFLITKN